MVRFKRVALFLFVLQLVAMASTGESARIMKDGVFQSLLENQLPRGPVPPSGPSLCHNKLNPLGENKMPNFTDDNGIVCP
ncbi:hypothetical protein CDL12_01272 [Handroanthus impetiginosus]|uniref:Neprosin activation peptide domain-containing protein n=1 Tax=Handroanthus impetiginosus TaxID=429701 RepID=A0A2G9I8B4_9LAMI|nr:hypothetical protein CDL12_01272 [Handroanthus impetiginosus]